jgi:hypothetical protein
VRHMHGLREAIASSRRAPASNTAPGSPRGGVQEDYVVFSKVLSYILYRGLQFPREIETKTDESTCADSKDLQQTSHL